MCVEAFPGAAGAWHPPSVPSVERLTLGFHLGFVHHSASGQQTPCVGVSIGIERVLTIMEARKQQQAQQEVATQGRRRSPFVEVKGGGLLRPS